VFVRPAAEQLKKRKHRRRRSTPNWAGLPAADYAYLLGLYLGDGHVVAVGRTFRLCLSLDGAYAGIVAEAAEALAAIVPANKVAVRPRRVSRCVDVSCYWLEWPRVLPQHGPGRKHTRPIALARWQERDQASTSRGDAARTHPFGRLQVRRSRAQERPGVSVRPIRVLQPLRRHQVDLLRPPRPYGRSLEADWQQVDLRRSGGRCRGARQLHRTQALTTVVPGEGLEPPRPQEAAGHNQSSWPTLRTRLNAGRSAQVGAGTSR
jgi:hypothetical protein